MRLEPSRGWLDVTMVVVVCRGIRVTKKEYQDPEHNTRGNDFHGIKLKTDLTLVDNGTLVHCMSCAICGTSLVIVSVSGC